MYRCILCMQCFARLSLQDAEWVSTHIFGHNHILSSKRFKPLRTFRCFFLNHFGCFIPTWKKRPMPPAGLLLLVTYLILAILYFFEGAGKDHSLAVLEWLAAFSSHVFHTTPDRHQWSVNIFFSKNSSRIFVYIHIYYGHDLLKWWL